MTEAQVNNRVGIIAATPLLQHQMQSVVAHAGYDVAVNTSVNRLNKKFLSNETIGVWLVALDDEDYWADFTAELIEIAEVPILFSDANVPAKTDENYARWQRRMCEKLNTTVLPSAKANKPDIDLNDLALKPTKPTYELPQSLKMAKATNVSSIWVLCASLGGPQAVKEFIDLLPADIPASFLYAQHIDSFCIEPLVSTIGRHAELKLRYAEHGIQLENGKVYVVPVDHEVKFTNNHGVVWQNNEWSGPYGPSHDHLLKNVSEHYGKRANAIVFSGMGHDGALGSMAVKEAGGTVWSQSTDSCIQSSMPDAADEVGAVDWRGNSEQLAEKLIQWLAENNSRAA